MRSWLIDHARRLGLLAHFTIVGVTVGLVIATGLARFMEVRLTDLVLAGATARATDHVAYLGVAGYLKEEDFALPHTRARLAGVTSRFDALVAQMRNDGSSLIRLQVFARDGTVLYSDLPDVRGESIDLDDEDHLAAALQGHLESEISELDGPENRGLRDRFGEALEVYVPVKLNGQIVGAYEIYEDLAPVRAIRPVVWGAVLSGFGLLLAALLVVVRAGAVLTRRFAHQATHDALTGLPNRALFLERLEHALADPLQRPAAVLFVDLDGLKLINDSLGHAAGDRLLITVARRMSRCLSVHDTVARLAGDEFIILIRDGADMGAVIGCAEKILAVLREPVVVSGQEVFVTGSVGIALSTPTTESAAVLLGQADAAMYQAKARGKNGYALFDWSMANHATERLALETDMHRALQRGEFVVHYQPIVELGTGKIVEVEALVRWHHPERGLIPPATFISVAEETGLIVPLGKWVLEDACRQATAWRVAYGPQAPVMNVNLSARQFQHPDLLNDVRRALEWAHLEASCLKLEITESVMMHDAEATAQTLRTLKDLGIRLAIDDFGTGYSSLAYLKRFPLDTLKIDRAFIKGLSEAGQDVVIVQSVVALARALGLSVTAEGVETKLQCAQVSALGCDRAQGYLFAEPQPAEAVESLFQAAAAPYLRAA